MSEKDQIGQLSCPTCDEEIATSAGLVFHQKHKLCRYKCKYCERKFVTVAEATAHQNKSHVDQMTEQSLEVEGKSNNVLNLKNHVKDFAQLPEESLILEEKSNHVSNVKNHVEDLAHVPEESLKIEDKSNHVSNLNNHVNKEDFTPVSEGCLVVEDKSNELEEWKQDPSLPKGWKALFAHVNGKRKEHFLSPNGSVFRSRDLVLKFLKKNSPDVNIEILKKEVFPGINSGTEDELSNKNFPISELKTFNLNKPRNASKLTRSIKKIKQSKQRNVKALAGNWIEDDPSVPPGWKIRSEDSSGLHFMKRQANKKELFLSPDGKMFSSRQALLDHLVKDKNSCAKDIDIVEKGMGKQATPWTHGSPDVPTGWKIKVMKGRRMFQSPNGEMFLGQVAVLEHLLSVGAPVQDLMKVELTGTKKMEVIWSRDKELPPGWMVRPVTGLGHTKEKSFYKAPNGRIYLGINKAIEEMNAIKLKSKPEAEVNDAHACIDFKSVTKDGDVSRSIRSHPSDQEIDDDDDDSDAISLSDDEAEVMLEKETEAEENKSTETEVVDDASYSTVMQVESGQDINEQKQIFSKIQLEILELSYAQWPHPFTELLNQLVTETSLKPEEIKKWFLEKNSDKIAQSKAKQKKHKYQINPELPIPNDHATTSDNSKTKTFVSKSKRDKTKRRLPADTLKVLIGSFKLDSETPNGERLDWLMEQTGMTKGAIKQWFCNRRWRLSNTGNQELATKQDKSATKSKKKTKGKKSPTKREKHQWIQDPTLPLNWTFCRIDGTLMFRSPDAHQFSSRMEVIKSFHT